MSSPTVVRLVRRVPGRWRLPLGCAGAGVLAALLTWAVLDGPADAYARPAVTLLGSGDRLSVLVTAGEARLLLAAGDDPTAFGNALGDVRPLHARRLDVLLVAGSGEGLLVPLAAADLGARYLASIGPLPPSPERAAFDPAPARLPDPARLRLPEGVEVTVETVPADPAEADAAPAAWRATVRRGGTSVVIVPEGEDVALLPPAPPGHALVVLGGGASAAVADARPRALAVNADRVEGKELRQEVAPLAPAGLWAVRVFPGEAVRLFLTDGGLRLPPASTQRLTPAPEIPVEPAGTPKEEVTQAGHRRRVARSLRSGRRTPGRRRRRRWRRRRR